MKLYQLGKFWRSQNKKKVGCILKITKLKNSWINYEKNKYENKKFDQLGLGL